MESGRSEVKKLLEIEDPVIRAAKALVASEEARELIAELTELRAEAVYEVVKRHGASAAARVFGTNRMNIYRTIRGPESRDPEVQARRAQSNQELAKTLAQMTKNYQRGLEGMNLAKTFKDEGELR
jgi:hypothetical protein